MNRNNRQKARSAFFGNNSGLETSKYSDNYLKPHTTRHITASLMAYDGIPLSMAQTILGHMSASMTQHYTHITSNMKRETIERFINDTNVQTMNNIVDETMKINNENKK
ncbi:tyrosine-type recombinase/integrase [Bifidobacterium catenulatum]|uniref:tyrosine-type recombinase/integrase n=1 Tax=Bifidobacterium catenulatum TaxID=1686 RepID=UPI003F8E13ED